MTESNDTIFSGIKPHEEEVSAFQRFLTGAIDLAIDLLILYTAYLLIPREILIKLVRISPLILYSMIIIVPTVYRLLFLMIFNKTVGMMICRDKLLNKDLLPLSNKEKLLSTFRTRFSKTKYYKDI